MARSKTVSVRFKASAAKECFDMITKMLPPRNLAELSALVTNSVRCVRAMLRTVEKDVELSKRLEVVLGAPVRDYFESCIREADTINDPSESLSRKFDCAWDVLITLLSVSAKQEEGEEA